MTRISKRKDLHGVISSRDADMFLADLANFDPKSYRDPSFERFLNRWGLSFPEYNFDDPEDTLDFFELLAFTLAPALRSAWSARISREREWHAINVRRLYHEIRLQRSELGLRLQRQVSAEQGDALGFSPPRVQSAERRTALGLPPLEKDSVDWPEHRDTLREFLRLRASLPPLTVLDASVQHFQIALERANVCQNPQCGAPYFLAKPGQKFCSDPCSIPAKREAKLRWWHKRGSRQRREKNKKARSN